MLVPLKDKQEKAVWEVPSALLSGFLLRGGITMPRQAFFFENPEDERLQNALQVPKSQDEES